MSPATESVLWWSVIGAGGASVLLLGMSVTHIVCDAECPAWVRDFPSHARELADTATDVARHALLWAAISLLLLATPHTPERAR